VKQTPAMSAKVGKNQEGHYIKNIMSKPSKK